ncbi:30S ribosomal S15 [Chlorella sorokiniana]|uniref:30S ribosomal protein S15 n=1 Tax=Chlorella sorokiniana TaxID=3076 RepID=A0A2P6TDV1_CHLSO|nr:30S ribosomal S15 [Chlorella sorokiniana]|eukprot:PRW20815.1 30S ribosomal S15 [Chlorella sorokiniana]
MAFAFSSVQARPAFCGTQLAIKQRAARPAAAAVAVSARYRGEGTDLSKVPAFERHGSDSGSPEVQIARLSARVQQLTEHLATHKKDYGSRRGLLAILSQRKQLMIYLQRTDRAMYERVLKDLNIRPLKREA